MRFCIPMIERARSFGSRSAIVDSLGKHSYAELVGAARIISDALAGVDQEVGGRVAILSPPDFRFVAGLWGTWINGQVAVPLCPQHPLAEWEHALKTVAVAQVLVGREYLESLRPLCLALNINCVVIEEVLSQNSAESESWAGERLPEGSPERPAQILFTSGTTSRPKGVVSTHANLQAQMKTLVNAWEWSEADVALNVLPLHHTHGLVNVVGCALWSGATLEMHKSFQVERVWERLASGELTVFMAVPTIYSRLLEDFKAASAHEQSRRTRALSQMRLMVSGSAALPIPVFEEWRRISGHALLERYGMTEIGMALSNPYRGERLPGMVGVPLPGVEVRVVDGQGQAVAEGEAGELWVKGSMVFKEYYGSPDSTAQAFEGEWFKTGDVVQVERGQYRIMGRQSVDIIKSGGYKISALEIEAVLRQHPAILDCAVVGVADSTWGERVAAAVLLRPGFQLSREELRTWAKEHLAPYKIPSQVVAVADFPKNVLGKVIKPKLKELF